MAYCVLSVRRHYWLSANCTTEAQRATKDRVYDYWISKDNNHLPQYYWVRCLDAGLLSITAILVSLFDHPERADLQLALLVLNCTVFIAYLVLILCIKPFDRNRLWARNFRVATLTIACLANVLRFCGSDSTLLEQSKIDTLATSIFLLLCVALAAAVISFEQSMFALTQDCWAMRTITGGSAVKPGQ